MLAVAATPAAVAAADIQLLNAHHAVVRSARTDAQGGFRFPAPPPGNHVLHVSGPGMAARESVTITAVIGQAGDAALTPQPLNLIGRERIEQRAKSVVAQAAIEEIGLALQSPGFSCAGSPGTRSTRSSTAAMRGGIDTFLNLIEPSAVDTLEALRGPTSAQYGSDALGGSVQFRSPVPKFSGGVAQQHELAALFNSADAGVGADWKSSYT